MTPSRRTRPRGDVLLAFALAADAVAAFLILRARFVPAGDGFRDLADVAGALLLATGGGVLAGTALVVYSKNAPHALTPWRFPLAGAFAVAGVAAAGVLGSVAWSSRAWGLVAFTIVVAGIAAAGLVLAARSRLGDATTSA